MNIHEHIMLELHVLSPYEFLVSLSYLEQHRIPNLCETKLRTLPPTPSGCFTNSREKGP